MKKFIYLVTALIMSITYTKSFAHCEIPCGIYDDEMRVHMLQEHILTIEKSMKKINELSTKAKDPQTYNQLVRWIMNKEKHAKKFQHIVWRYFLTQRVKPVSPENHKEYEIYLKKLELLHKLSFYAMKAKQTVDLKYIDILRKTLLEFEEVYFGKKHIEEHHKH
ncbi:MAG: superoxide dismutase [Aquificae bacterium]|nr:superoxide dismutase [Aquificota bacterium]